MKLYHIVDLTIGVLPLRCRSLTSVTHEGGWLFSFLPHSLVRLLRFQLIKKLEGLVSLC